MVIRDKRKKRVSERGNRFIVASCMGPWQSHWEEENSEVNHDLDELYKSTVSGSLALTDLAFQFADI